VVCIMPRAIGGRETHIEREYTSAPTSTRTRTPTPSRTSTAGPGITPVVTFTVQSTPTNSFQSADASGTKPTLARTPYPSNTTGSVSLAGVREQAALNPISDMLTPLLCLAAAVLLIAILGLLSVFRRNMSARP
jgi:hypothetical protein